MEVGPENAGIGADHIGRHPLQGPPFPVPPDQEVFFAFARIAGLAEGKEVFEGVTAARCSGHDMIAGRIGGELFPAGETGPGPDEADCHAAVFAVEDLIGVFGNEGASSWHTPYRDHCELEEEAAPRDR